MAYYDSYHSIVEFMEQSKGRLLLDEQRLQIAKKETAKGKKSRIMQLLALAEAKAIPVEKRSKQALESLLDRRHYRGYILQLEGEQTFDNLDLNSLILNRPKLVVLLDGVLNIGNLGALLRSCDAFEIGAVLISHRSAGSDLEHSRELANQLARASAGASAWVPIIQGNLVQMARQLQQAGYWLYGADMAGTSTDQTTVQEPCALILGSEEDGLSQQLLKLSDHLISIPTSGQISSLNVAAAGAILLYEIKRQWNNSSST